MANQASKKSCSFQRLVTIKTVHKYLSACSSGRYAAVESTRQPMQRFSKDQINHFVDYIVSPTTCTDVPFGEKKLKLSDGKKIVVGNTIRNVYHTKLIQQYQLLCKQTSFTPLGDSSLFAILRCCSASIRKCLAGLDCFAADGSSAFDVLSKLCDVLVAYGNCFCFVLTVKNYLLLGMTSNEAVELKDAFHKSRNYIKCDYKYHISTESHVADHCSMFALSDTENDDWQQKCNHPHDEQ